MFVKCGCDALVIITLWQAQAAWCLIKNVKLLCCGGNATSYQEVCHNKIRKYIFEEIKTNKYIKSVSFLTIKNFMKKKIESLKMYFFINR